MTISTEYALLAIGNPLLDMVADVTPDFLAKYKLEANNAILAGEEHQPLYGDLVNSFPTQFIAGGAAQNSIRGAQWMLPPMATSYFGCVGKDAYALKMREAAAKDGVRALYQEESEHPTGTCAVLVTGNHRSLVANLAAANHFKVSHLEKAECWQAVEAAKFIYSSGFFLTVSPESILKLAKHALETNKTFIMNLSAPFLCQFFKAPMLECMPYCNVLFGNESEAAAFAETNGFNTKDVAEIAKKLAALPSHSNRPRMVIITQGADPTIVVQDGVVKSFPVIPIKPENIVDTNGAGDAFVGGFFSQLVQGKPLEDCVRAANYLANIVIQRSGATYPETPCTFA